MFTFSRWSLDQLNHAQRIYFATFLILGLIGGWFWYFQAGNASEFPEPLQQEADQNLASQFTVPICRNGLYMPDSKFQNVVQGGSQGIDVGWFIRFGPYPQQDYYRSGVDAAGMIRFKPRFDQNGQRTGDYVLAKGLDDNGSDNGVPNEYYFLPYGNTTLSGQWDDGWRDVILRNPGALWIVGNEMDRVDLQDSLYPDTFAKAYYESYHFIKSTDPTAQVAIGGILAVTPGRLQYLDLFWQAYEDRYDTIPPIDVWTFHAYQLPEVAYYDRSVNSAAALALGTDPNIALTDARQRTEGGTVYTDTSLCPREEVICIAEVDDVELFKKQVVAMRQWMKDRGQQNKPLILTEWSNLYPLDSVDEFGNQMTHERAAVYLNATLNYLETAADPNLGYPRDDYRLVQRWNWFQPNPIDPQDIGGSSLMFSTEGVVTSVGETYQNRILDQASREGLYIDMAVYTVQSGGAVPNPADGSANIDIGVIIRNLGNIPTTQPATVVFRDLNGNVIGSSEIPPGLQGCASYTAQSLQTWFGLPVGKHDFTVEVISNEEPQERWGNNYGNGVALVGRHNVFIPMSNTYE